MLDALYNRYAELIRQRDALDEEIEKARAEILADMQHHEIDNFKRDVGTFSVVYKPTYVFSEEVEKLTKEVAKRKEFEKENDIALVETKPTLAFRPAK